MAQTYPIIAGAEPWSAPGSGDRARVGVVVIHGFTGNPTTTRPLGEVIARAGYAVDVIRLPGHGTHWRDLSHTRYEDWQRASADAVSALGARVDKVVVAGLSMGGMLALDVASADPARVAGVISINLPILDRAGIVAKLAPIISMLIPAVPASAAGLIKNDSNREGVDERAYQTVPTKAGDSVVRHLPRVRARIRGLRVPVLAVYSEGDRSVPNENTRALPSLVGEGGQVTLLPLPRSRHLATLDLDRELLEERAIEFIGRVTGS